ncbi:MAG: HD family phosphohydrolase [Dethiobacteria bacterium]
MKIKPLLKKYIYNSFSLTGKMESRRLILGISLFVIIYAILFFSIRPIGVSVELGMPSPQRITANREVVDYYTTNMLREEAAAAVSQVFDQVPDVLEDGKSAITGFMAEIRRVKGLQDAGDGGKADLVRRALGDQFSDEFIYALMDMSNYNLEILQRRMETIFEEIVSQGVKEEGIQSARKQLSQEVNLLPYDLEIRRGAEVILLPLIEPNLIFNAEATQAKREAAMMEVEQVIIPKKSLIVQEGEKITEKHIAQLEALGLLGPRIHLGGYFGLFFILLIIFSLVTVYLYLFHKDIYENVTYLLLLGLILVLTLVFGLAACFFSGYLIPVAMSGILITVLFEPRLAVLMNIILTLLLGFVIAGEFNHIVVLLAGGLVAIYSVTNLQRRSDLSKAGIFVALVNVVSIVALYIFSTGFQLDYDFLREFSIAVLAGLGNGLFSAVMAIGLLPYLESAFGITTAVTLLELSDPGRPLLRKMLMEAPGTYHHSVVVGNLAEAAAESVGADPLLCRVSAFYHDIGKIKRPYFFVENQFAGDNPHNKISPNLSALIIRSHVKDGVEFAREAKLPLPVIDIIRQHHGTSMISFFYQQALERDKEINVSEEEFRYEGPLPQSKEAAIILLSDSVEAAVRSLSRPVAGRIEGMVRRIIKEKLNDGQLDEAPLTLKDLDKIGDTFVHILTGIFHRRIEYPEKELRADLERGKNKNAGAGK